MAISRSQITGLERAQSTFTREDDTHSGASNKQLAAIKRATDKDNESYYCHVPPELRHEIWDNEYVNLWEVLLEYRLSPAEVVIVDKETGPARVERKAIKIDSLSKSIEAFGIYAAVYSVGRPHLAPHLFQYFTSICKYASTLPWNTVCEYDKDCRSEIARDSSKTWADFDILLWNHKRKAQNPPRPSSKTASDPPIDDDDDNDLFINYNFDEY